MINEFNLITGKLPCDVIVNGLICPIYTNTSICMDCLVALESDIPQEAKKKIVLGRLFSGTSRTQKSSPYSGRWILRRSSHLFIRHTA